MTSKQYGYNIPFTVHRYVERSNTVLEFLGCHYHSCSKCYSANDVNKTTGRLRHFEHEETMNRLKWIEGQGYTMVTMRECEFHDLVKRDASLQQFMEERCLSEPLRPYDALFGGRTNAVQLYHECADDEEIKVLDFTSLYPWVRCSS